MKTIGKKRDNRTAMRAINPPPSDADVRQAAILALMRSQLEMIERARLKDRALKIEPPEGVHFDLLPGVTLEQLVARSLVEGVTARGLADGLALPRVLIENAIADLAAGAHVDWTPRPHGKAVA